MKALTAWSASLLLLLSLLSLALEAAGKDPCSKDWLRYMVVNACGMDKRHLRGKPTVSPAVMEILNEVDTQWANWKAGRTGFFDDADDDDDDDNDDGLGHHPTAPRKASEARKLNATKDTSPEATSSAANFFIRLFQHPGQAVFDAWMGLMGSEPKRAPQRRAAVQNLISQCCSEDCDEDSFKGVCD